MSESSTGASPAAPAKSLKERLDRVERELSRERKRMARSTRLTVCVGAVALVLLVGYFYFGYTQFEEITQPQKLVAVADTLLIDHLPQARRALQAEIDKSAPSWAEQLSTRAQDALPTARESLENYISDQIDLSVEESTGLTEKQFRTYIEQNREALEKSFNELGSSPELAAESLSDLESLLDEHMSTDLQTQSEEVLGTLLVLNEKLQKLQAGKGLNREEKIERQVLMLAQRLKLQEADPEVIGKQGRARRRP